MHQITNTSIVVSPICLGTMTFGRPVGEKEAIRLVHWALDHGINFFDTADMYEGYDRTAGSAGGVAETILGKALEGRRERAIITTKVGNAVGDDQYAGSGLGRTHILHQVEASLRRLQTDTIDFYLLHRPDSATPLSESIATMAELITTGKIRYWGISNFSAAKIRIINAICQAQRWPRPVISQPAYSWLKRDVEAGHLSLCQELGIAVTPYQPLQGGLLTGKYRAGQKPAADSRLLASPNWLQTPDAEMYTRLQQFEAEAQTADLMPPQYAVHWLLGQTAVKSVVVGVKSIEQLQEFEVFLRRKIL
ncbi:MAG: aldo/keto reductase [Chloroflexota bacterium]